MPSNSPNAGVAVTVIAGGPSGAVAVSTTASTATATTAASVGVTGLYLLSVGSKNPMLEVNLTAGATVATGAIIAPLGAGVGGSCSKIRISTCPSISNLTQSLLPVASPFHPFPYILSIRAIPTTSSEISTYQEPGQQRPWAQHQGCAFRCAGRACQ